MGICGFTMGSLMPAAVRRITLRFFHFTDVNSPSMPTCLGPHRPL